MSVLPLHIKETYVKISCLFGRVVFCRVKQTVPLYTYVTGQVRLKEKLRPKISEIKLVIIVINDVKII